MAALGPPALCRRRCPQNAAGSMVVLALGGRRAQQVVPFGAEATGHPTKERAPQCWFWCLRETQAGVCGQEGSGDSTGQSPWEPLSPSPGEGAGGMQPPRTTPPHSRGKPEPLRRGPELQLGTLGPRLEKSQKPLRHSPCPTRSHICAEGAHLHTKGPERAPSERT